MLYVDQTYGSDSGPTIGLRNRFDRPFLTPQAAKAAAMAGDLIHVGPGTYGDKNLLKNGVNWYWEEGAKGLYTGTTDGAIFDDGPSGANGPVICTIDGLGEFEWVNDAPAATTSYGNINIENAGSHVTINCKSLKFLGTNTPHGWNVLQQDGLLNLNVEEGIYSPNEGYHLGWFGGTAWIKTANIEGKSAAITWRGNSVGGNWYVDCQSIIGTGSDILISVTTPDTVGALWINANLIKGDMSFSVISGDSGKVYINAQKIWNTNTSAPIINCSGMFLWATVQKMTAESGSFFICEASTGTVVLEVQQYESKLVGESTGYGSIYNEGANLTLIGGVMTITNAGETQKGLEHVDGTTLVKGTTFDLSGNDQADSYPVFVGGAGLTLEGCVLKPPTGTPSVGGSSVSFVANGSTGYGPLAATVIATGNFFYNQGGPSAGDVPTADADGTWRWVTPTGGGGGAPAGDGIVSVTGGVFDTPSTIGDRINASTAKATPVDADMIGLMDSAASNVLKKLSWANIKATLKTYFDTLYSPTALTIRTYTGTTDALVLTDAGNWVRSGNAAANIMTIPTNASVAFPIGTQIAGNQYGAGQMSIAPDGGVTLNSSGGARKLVMQYSPYLLTKTDTNEWHLTGEITT